MELRLFVRNQVCLIVYAKLVEIGVGVEGVEQVFYIYDAARHGLFKSQPHR